MSDKHYHLPAALIIMDGFGIAPAGPGNAISQARTPHIDALWQRFPHMQIQASCEPVGLPAGQMGNSEVGHLNIGAGRVVFQELTRINNACRDGSIEDNPAFVEAMDTASAPGAVLHIMGLLSDGGVHSSNEHLYALLAMAAKRKVPQVFVHCFMDGRDVSPTSGKGFVEELEGKIAALSSDDCRIRIASISGRYYAMDRDTNWDRVQKAYDAMVRCAPRAGCDPVAFMQASYDNDVTDEFVVPASFVDRGIESRDAAIFFNFRPDRARQMARALTDRDFAGFERPDVFPHFVCCTEYDPSIDATVAFPKEFPEHVLADVIAQAGLRQYHIAETEKYAHVTFFINGGREEPKQGEVRKLIPSPKVATYDLQPEMSEPAVADALAAAIDNDEADFYIVNFANCDMVGHTGSIPAAIKAVEAVDEGVGKVVAALERKHGLALLTADHGNADVMVSDAGEPFTQHTTNPVPLVMIDFSGQDCTFADVPEGEVPALSNLAPTLLDMAGLRVPAEMTAPSLLRK